MRRWIPVVMAAGLAMAGVGCVPSINMERSLLRGAGDTSITAVADGTQGSDLQARLVGARAVATTLLAFTNTGGVALLTTAGLRAELLQRVSPDYALLVDQAIAMVSTKHIDVGGAIGVRNVKRVKAYLVGVLRGVKNYKEADR